MTDLAGVQMQRTLSMTYDAAVANPGLCFIVRCSNAALSMCACSQVLSA